MPPDTCSAGAPALPRLFVLGDSISIHYGPFLEQMLSGRFTCDRKGRELLANQEPDQALLARLAGLDSSLPALNGGDSACVLSYLRDCRPACDLLLLNCGLHDLRIDPSTGSHQVELAAYAANLDEILRLASSAASQVVWVRTTPVFDAHHNRLSPGFHRFNADVIAYNAIADACVRQAGYASIDLYAFTLGLVAASPRLEDSLVDHVHFAGQARRLQAAYITGWLEAYAHA